MKKAVFYKVKSFTDPNKIYDVIHLPDGSWTCNCAHFIFNKIWMCKHIKKVRHIKFKPKKGTVCATCGKTINKRIVKKMKKYGFKDCLKCRQEKENRYAPKAEEIAQTIIPYTIESIKNL